MATCQEPQMVSILDCDVMEDRAMTYPDTACRGDLLRAIGFLRSKMREVADMQQKLNERKVVERAKGVLQRRFRWTEAEAFRRLQRGAMNRRVPMFDIANAVLSGKEVDL